MLVPPPGSCAGLSQTPKSLLGADLIGNVLGYISYLPVREVVDKEGDVPLVNLAMVNMNPIIIILILIFLFY